ncbi:hypothetical protein E2C01_067228 [Portunus trituberculatus]|uniref:Uncharacterized protein n=1 Tax=Portunus trituberculatus TaxID=210409 RepID=A0A5B7HT28_PORTR|nr:hypothetical protein [Portunus trituberculatus]
MYTAPKRYQRKCCTFSVLWYDGVSPGLRWWCAKAPSSVSPLAASGDGLPLPLLAGWPCSLVSLPSPNSFERYGKTS